MNGKLLKLSFVMFFAIALAIIVYSANFYTTPIVQVTPVLGAHVINDTSVVAQWRFEKPSNATFTDDYLDLNNGTVNAANWTEQGRVGGAYVFAGSALQSYVNVTHSQRLNLTGPRTVLAWINAKAFTNYAGIVAKGDDCTSTCTIYEISHNQTGFLEIQLPNSVVMRGSTKMSTSVWYLVGTTYNGTAAGTNVTLWLNGAPDASLVTNSTQVFGTNITRNLHIGGYVDGSQNFYFNGTIDEVTIFNRTLSAQEMQNYYQEGFSARLLKEADLGVAVVNASNYSRVVYDWRENGLSVALLNLPFEPDHVALETDTGGHLIYFPFENESSISFAANLAPYSNASNSTHINGSTPVITPKGMVGSAMLFDGVALRGLIVNGTATTINLSATQNFTLEVWALSNTSNITTTILDRYQNSNGILQLYKDVGTNISCRIRGDDNVGITTITYNQFTPNAWHHIACVRDSAVDNLSIYVDGVLRNSTTDGTTDAISGIDYLIGGAQGGTLNWNGTIDELMLWNRSLTAAEITAHYKQGLNVKDFSTFGNNGTLTNLTINNPFFNTSGGKIGGGMVFGGVSQNISLTQPALNVTVNISVEVWVNVKTSSNQAANYIISKFVGGTSGWALGFLGTSAACSGAPGEIFVYNGTHLSCSGVVMLNNTWYHIAFTNNGSVTSLYVNGALEDTTAMGFTTITNPLLIGTREGGLFALNGTLDEVRIYNRTLSAEEILSHYQLAYNNLKSNETKYRNNYTAAVTIGNDYALNDTIVSNLLQVKPLQAPNFYTNISNFTAPYAAGHMINDSYVIGYWRFEKPSNGTLTNDFLGISNLTVNNATWTEQGPVGGGYSFNGIGNYLNFSGASVFDMGVNNWSILAWVRTNDTKTTLFVAKANTLPYYYMAIVSGKLRGAFANTTTIITVDSASAISDDRWHQAVITYNRVQNMTVYVDGIQSGATSISSNENVSIANSNLFSIGANCGSGTCTAANYLNGSLDEVILYNRTLSSSEVYAHFAAGNASRVLTRNDLGGAVTNATNYTRFIYDWRQNNISIATLYMPFEPNHLPLDPDAVLYLPFENESNSTVASDLTSFGNNGTVVNTIYNASGGFIGGAYQFNATAGVYINITTIVDNTTQRNLTIEAWIKPLANSACYQIVSKATATNAGRRSYGLYYAGTSGCTGGPGLGFNIVNSSGNSVDVVKGGANITLNVWNHVAGTYNGTLMTWYINGVSVGTNAQAGDINVSSNPLIIGSFDATNSPFSGSIDELVIYNRSLTAAEISAHYGRGAIIRDFSTYGNNATFANSTANPTYNKTGKVGSGMLFDGINDNLTLPTVNILNRTSNITVEAWINVRATGYVVNYFLSKFNNGAQTGWSFGVYGPLGSSICSAPNRVFLFNGANGASACSTTVLNNNTWYHVAFTNNGTTTFLYVNGVLENRSIQQPLAEIALPLVIGGRDGGTFYFNGTVDEVRIYNRTLSSDEILSHYQQSYEDLRAPETTKSQNYSVAVTLGNDYSFNDTLTSNIVYINNTPPYWTSPPTINSTYGYNGTHENLTCYGGTAVDDDSDNGTILYDWRIGNFSDAILNMPMDGGNATFIPDISSYGNNASVINATYNSSGVIGGSYVFNGQGNTAGSYASVLMSPSLNASSFTVSVWVNPATTARGDYVAIWNSGSDSVSKFDLLQGVSAGRAQFFVSAGSAVSSGSGTTIMKNNTWYFIVGTYNNATGNASIYVNGVLENSSNLNINVNKVGLRNLTIGRNSAADGFFNGSLDQLLIFNRSLSSSEIQSLFLNQSYIFQNTTRYKNYTCVATSSDGEIINNGIGAPNAVGPSNSTSNLLAILGCNSVITSTDALEGDLYYPAAPNNACINLSAPNITFSGAGFNIFGNLTSAFGVFINSTNVTLSNIFLDNLSAGVVTRNAHNSTINNTIASFSQDAQIWLRNTTDLLLQASNLTGRTIGLFIDNSSNTNIFNILFNSSEIAIQAIDGTGNLIINGSANGIGNMTFYGRLGSRDTHIYNFTQTIHPPRQFNLTGGSNLTITNSTIRRDNISTDSTSWLYLRWYANISVYANNQSTTPLQIATIEANSSQRTSEKLDVTNEFAQFMLVEAIFNNSQQLNYTPYNLTANSSAMGYLENFTNSTMFLESMNFTITLSQMIAGETGGGGGGSAGHTGDIAFGGGCDVYNGFFLINNSCKQCPGYVIKTNISSNITNQTTLTYACKLCDDLHYYNESTNTCDPLIYVQGTNDTDQAGMFSKLGKNGAKVLLIFLIIAILVSTFIIGRKKRKEKKKKEQDEAKLIQEAEDAS